MKIEHDEAGHRFVIRLPDGIGQLVYRVPREGVIDLHHTEVDAALQGQGVAAALAQAAFDHVRARGMKAVVTCPYVRAWLKRHPEQRELVVG